MWCPLKYLLNLALLPSPTAIALNGNLSICLSWTMLVSSCLTLSLATAQLLFLNRESHHVPLLLNNLSGCLFIPLGVKLLNMS